jgi:hypothetical protein
VTVIVFAPGRNMSISNDHSLWTRPLNVNVPLPGVHVSQVQLTLVTTMLLTAAPPSLRPAVVVVYVLALVGTVMTIAGFADSASDHALTRTASTSVPLACLAVTV